MESDGSPDAGDLAADLSRAIARLSRGGEAVADALAQGPRIDPVAGMDALASVRQAARLLDQASAMLSAADYQEAAAPAADPVDGWALAVATAIEQANPERLSELAGQTPQALPPMIVMAAKAAATGDWVTGRLLADYVLGRIVGMGASPELGRAAGATAVLAARAWMTTAEAPQRCQGYLQLAQSHSGTTARLEAALAQRQRATGDLGLAQDSAVHSCSLDSGYPRGHVERALAFVAVGSDPSEAVHTAADTASVRSHPYEALTDLVGGVPDAVLLCLAQACQIDRPELARRVLDKMLTAGEPYALSPSEDRQETTLRQADAYRLRAALPRTPGADGSDADTGTADTAADLYYAAALVVEFDEQLCYDLLTQVLAHDPQHRNALFLLSDLRRTRAEQAVPPDAGLLDEAAGQLKRAEQSPMLPTDVEWERLVLANMLMSQASARPQHALDLLLEAALQLERSVLDGTASVWLHVAQSRVFSRLDLWAWAAAAVERAASLSPDAPDLREQQVLININRGAYQTVVERTADEPLSDWLRTVRAIAIGQQGDALAAVELLAPLVSEARAPVWYRLELARAYDLAGQPDDARAQLEEIITAERTEWSIDSERAKALLLLGRLEEAEKTLQQWWPDPSDQAGRQWRLALCRLTREPDQARGPLLAGLEAEAMPDSLATVAWELDAAREVAGRLDVKDPRRAEALAALQEARSVADRRLRDLQPEPDLRAELQRCLRLWSTPLDGSDTSPGEAPPTAHTLVAALTARLAIEQSTDARDLALYAELRGTALDGVVPDILRRRSAAVRAEIGAAVSREDHQHAHMLYQVLCAAAGDPVTDELAALGVALAVRRGDLPGTSEACAQALAATPTAADAARSVLSADLPVDQETLLLGLAAAAARNGAAEGHATKGTGARKDSSAAGSAPVRPSPAATLLAAVSAEVGRRAIEGLGRPAPTASETRRLVAELGAALVPEDTSSAWKLFGQDIPEMRERVRDRLGLDLSGILVRYGALDQYAFRVLLDGLEVTTGELVPDEQADGRPAPERLEALTEAIERTVLAAPGSFLTLNQLEPLVQQAPAFWADVPPNPRAVSELAGLTASPETMARLTSVLSALLDDGLHVREIADLAALVQRAGGLHDDRAEVVRRIRSEAAGHLVAARPGSRGMRLREDLEQTARAAAETAPSKAGGADGRDGTSPRSGEIVDLLVRTWPEVLQTCRATEMPVVVVADELTRAWLQQVLRDHLLPGVAVTAAEVPSLAAEVPPAWRSAAPVTPQVGSRPLPRLQ
jgi:tetratricopeptide (TPR) repeat protein